MPKVWNSRDLNTPLNAVYVGRPSPWGNPYPMHGEKTRARCIERFKDYAEKRLLTDPHWLDSLRGKDLICWCAPLPCHADVLLKLANREVRV